MLLLCVLLQILFRDIFFQRNFKTETPGCRLFSNNLRDISILNGMKATGILRHGAEHQNRREPEVYRQMSNL